MLFLALGASSLSLRLPFRRYKAAMCVFPDVPLNRTHEVARVSFAICFSLNVRVDIETLLLFLVVFVSWI